MNFAGCSEAAFQNDILFEDTIFENIRFGRELSEEEIIEASEYVMAKMSYDIDTINTSFSNDLIQIFASAITVIGSFLMMITIFLILCLIFTIITMSP